MKYTIDVEDFYLEDGDLAEELKSTVIRQVTDAIWKKIEKKVDEQIERTVKNAVEQQLSLKINLRVADVIATEMITYNGKQMPMVDYVKEMFLKNNTYSNPIDTIGKFAKKFGDELRARYDVAFANQIVLKMNEVGLLKEEAITKLLDKKN